MHIAWARLFSRMLDVIIPLAVEYEFDNKESIDSARTKRLIPSTVNSMKPTMITMGTMGTIRSNDSE